MQRVGRGWPGQAGDGVGSGGAPFLALGQGSDPAGDADGLGGVRERQPGRDAGGLQGAVLLAANAPRNSRTARAAALSDHLSLSAAFSAAPEPGAQLHGNACHSRTVRVTGAI